MKRELNLENHPLIGMVHLPQLDSGIKDLFKEIIPQTCQEAKKLEKAGFSAILVENFNDFPYSKDKVTNYVLLKAALIVSEILKEINIPIGLNLLRNACQQAYSVASVLELAFIRCNIWEGAYVTDQGIIEGVAREVIQLRKKLSTQVKVLADVHVKYAKPLGSFSIEEAANNALKRGQASAVIISGKKTGEIPAIEKLEKLKVIGIKPIIGSGLKRENINEFAPFIKGAIVGTSIKKDGDVYAEIDIHKSKEFVKEWNDVFQKE